MSGLSSYKTYHTSGPLHPWVWPEAPWRRIDIDFAGPFMGKMFFVVVDAHSI